MKHSSQIKSTANWNEMLRPVQSVSVSLKVKELEQRENVISQSEALPDPKATGQGGKRI